MSILNYEEMTLESDTFQAARETLCRSYSERWNSLIWTREVSTSKLASN